MKKIIISAFACDPTKGSEASNGWNWATGLVEEGFEVHCFTRTVGREGIESKPVFENLKFHYVELPYGGEKLYSTSTMGMYFYYILWQWIAYRRAKKLHEIHSFDLSHHVSWGSTQMGSFMYKIGIPFIFGPAGGGQQAPTTFKKYFLSHWSLEEKRHKISNILVRFNPACASMLKKAYTVLVSNPDTERIVRDIGAQNVISTLDCALPENFFPNSEIIKNGTPGRLRLLWVGRFLPRKGLLLLVDIMKELKEFPGITLTVVGDGEMKTAFLEKIDLYGLHTTVYWAGKVKYEDVKSFYANHDAFVFTSLRDSCPAQLVEAMAYSMPVITINLHGQAIIVNNQTGFVSNCDTPEIAIENVKQAILQLYHDPVQLANKGKAAHEFALQQTWKKKINTIVTQYYPPL